MDRRSRSRSRSHSPSPRCHTRQKYHSEGFEDRENYSRDNSRGSARNVDENGIRENRDHRARDRERLECERRERMARMRLENEAEERGESTIMTDGDGVNNASGAVAKIHLPLPEHNISKNNQGDNDDEIGYEQQQMMNMMGFGRFETTKGKAVADNKTSAARGAASKNKGRKYRQYMNRKGGFNRPLDKMN